MAARRLRPRRAAAVHDSALRERGLLDYDVVDGLFAAHAAGRGDWSKHLWNLYCVSRWYDRWIAGATHNGIGTSFPSRAR